MPTDAEIIRHLAENVMGWPVCAHGSGWMESNDGVTMICRHGWNPLNDIADCMEVQAVVLAGQWGGEYSYLMTQRGYSSDGMGVLYAYLLSAPARIRALAMYRATGGAE